MGVREPMERESEWKGEEEEGGGRGRGLIIPGETGQSDKGMKNWEVVTEPNLRMQDFNFCNNFFKFLLSSYKAVFKFDKSVRWLKFFMHGSQHFFTFLPVCFLFFSNVMLKSIEVTVHLLDALIQGLLENL